MQIILRTSSDVLHFEGLFWKRYKLILKGQIVFEGHWSLQSWTLASTWMSDRLCCKNYDFVLKLQHFVVTNLTIKASHRIQLSPWCTGWHTPMRHSGAFTWAIVERQTTSSIPSPSTYSVPFFCNSFWQFMPRPPSKRRQGKIYQGLW